MTANPTPPDTTQQNDGQKQADICPWDASMPLREDMNYNDLVARWTEMSGSMSKADAAILFASEMTRADNTAIRDELARLRYAIVTLNLVVDVTTKENEELTSALDRARVRAAQTPEITEDGKLLDYAQELLYDADFEYKDGDNGTMSMRLLRLPHGFRVSADLSQTLRAALHGEGH
jgi:hypothetical protein